MTAQTAERIDIAGHDLRLCADPLRAWLRQHDKPPMFVVSNTGNWRGYVGRWIIDEGRLWLSDIDAKIVTLSPDDDPFSYIPSIWGRSLYTWKFAEKFGSKKATINDLFPSTRGPVFASWFTGTLRIPQGERLAYVHSGWFSIWEWDLFVEVEEGIMVKQELYENWPLKSRRGMFEFLQERYSELHRQEGALPAKCDYVH